MCVLVQACAAVREAAEILVSRLRPLTQGLGDSYTWQQLVAKACPVPGFRGPVSGHAYHIPHTDLPASHADSSE